MQVRLLFLFLVIFSLSLSNVTAQNSQEYKTIQDIGYYDYDQITSQYQRERCMLDIYYPVDQDSFATIVWFHGGGIRAGQKSIPKELQEQGVAVIAVNYRLFPNVKSPVYIQDAAASVAWAFSNIEKYGGLRDRIFVSGHSAGGYLASMIGLDTSYLAAFDINANDLAGLIPFSGHAITHFTVREERGIDGKTVVVDHLAPIAHIRSDAPPYIIVTGDRNRELLGRYEENAYMWRMMQLIGHPDCSIYELDSFNHGDMYRPACAVLLKEVNRILKKKAKKNP